MTKIGPIRREEAREEGVTIREVVLDAVEYYELNMGEAEPEYLINALARRGWEKEDVQNMIEQLKEEGHLAEIDGFLEVT